jgi:ribonuclease P protein component
VIGRRDILAADYETLLSDLRRALAAVARPKSVRSVQAPGPSPSPIVSEPGGTRHA